MTLRNFVRSINDAFQVISWLVTLLVFLTVSEATHAQSQQERRIKSLSGSIEKNDLSKSILDRCSKKISPKIVVFIGSDPADLLQFNGWLDGKVDAVQLDGGMASWDDWLHSLDWIGEVFKPMHVAFRWSVPLFPKGANLEEASLGVYNGKYKELAKQFVRRYGAARKIDIRLGWEFNGKDWNPWSAVGKALLYQKAYQNFVSVFRNVSSNFVFEWTPNIGEVGMNPEDAYPGDSYVDIIGLDFYYNTAWNSADPIKAWNKMVHENYGLQWHQDFAAAHHKPTAYAEWGVNSEGSGPFILLAANWFCSHEVVYQSYWNSNSEFAGKLSDGQYPGAGAVYRSAIGGKECLSVC